MYRRRKRKKMSKRTKAWFVLFFVVLFITILFVYLTSVVNPIIVEASEAKIKSVTQDTLNNSVLDAINDENIYEKLISYSYGADNKISLITVNSHQANILARSISIHAQDMLDKTTKAGVDVHLGAFTGLAAFATLGPTITFNLSPIGAVAVKFKSEFTSAGINQTLHKLFISVDSSVYVILPTASPKIDASTEVLIAECVLIGEVPDTYLQSSYLDEMLNLVPT